MFFSSRPSIPSVTVHEAKSKSKDPGAILVDVREQDEYRDGHAEGAINMPLSTLGKESIEKLKGYALVYVICLSGGRSARASSFFIEHGISAINVEGGTSAWKASGLPIK